MCIQDQEIHNLQETNKQDKQENKKQAWILFYPMKTNANREFFDRVNTCYWYIMYNHDRKIHN